MGTAVTVAQELGHFSLTDQHRVLFEKGALHRSESGFTSSAWYESEADLFGVELLIPEFLFHKHRKQFPTGLDGVKGLAELFETSLTETGIRYAALSTEPVAVVVSEGDRILQSVLSRRFAARFGQGAPRESGARQVPEESVTRRLNVGGKVVAEERGFVPATRWFPGDLGRARGRGDRAGAVWEDFDGSQRARVIWAWRLHAPWIFCRLP